MEKACIFDLDGTLVDSIPIWKKALWGVFAAHGVPETMRGAFESAFAVGKTLPSERAAVLYKETLGIDADGAVVAQEIVDRMYYHYTHDIDLKPGVLAYLQALKSRGVGMCIATAGPRETLMPCIARLGIAPLFDFTINCYEVGKGKEFPDIFLAAAKRFDLAPADVTVFDDSPRALITAKNAGFRTMAVYEAACAEEWDGMVAQADRALIDWREADPAAL